jgi:hypothetical protein
MTPDVSKARATDSLDCWAAWQAAHAAGLREGLETIDKIVREMRVEIESRTLPIVHDAATGYWADRIESAIRALIPSTPDTEAQP